jgi:hypothetical protein
LLLEPGQSHNFGQYASDPQGDPLRFSLVDPVPQGYSINRYTGVVSTSLDAVEGNLTIRASDKQFSADHTCSIYFQSQVNTAPYWNAGAEDPRVVFPGQPFSFDLIATDDNGDLITFTTISASPELTLTPWIQTGNTRRITVSGIAGTSGSYSLTIRCTDSGGLYDTATCAVTVQSAQTGSFTHGDLVSITGAGFGATMPTFGFAGGADGPLEVTAVGATPVDGSGWNWDRFDRIPTVGTDATRGKALLFTLSGSGSGNYEACSEYTFSSGGIPLGGRLYMTYWIRADWTNAGGGQFKLYRVCGDSDISDTNTNIVVNCLNASENHTMQENPGGGGNAWGFYGGNGEGAFTSTGQWQRIELFIITNTVQGTRNGQVLQRVFKGASVPTPLPFIYTDWGPPRVDYDIRSQALNYAFATRYKSIIWQNHVDASAGYSNAVVGNDDHYVGMNSFSRVELWNSPTPTSATLREIQKPTSWADSSVTVRLNKGGSFTTGTAYLVVLGDSVTDTVLGYRQITLV